MEANNFNSLIENNDFFKRLDSTIRYYFMNISDDIPSGFNPESPLLLNHVILYFQRLFRSSSDYKDVMLSIFLLCDFTHLEFRHQDISLVNALYFIIYDVDLFDSDDY